MDFKRIRKPGDIDKLRIKVWRMVLKAEKIALDTKTDKEVSIRAIHACIQSAGAYMKILEFTDLEDRISKLEEHYEHKKTG